MNEREELEELCDYVCKWINKHRGKSPAKIRDDYPKMMRRVLTVWFLMSKDAAKSFIDGACVGNWERLHLTSVEKVLDADVFADELLDDLWYSSDRWSWDRVLRIQWLYQRVIERCCYEDRG